MPRIQSEIHNLATAKFWCHEKKSKLCDMKSVKDGTKLRLKKLMGILKMPSSGQDTQQKCLEGLWDILILNT